MPSITTPSWALSDLTRALPATQALAHRILAEAAAQDMSALWLGQSWKQRDTYPDHPSGEAADYMVGPAGGIGDRATGDWLADMVIGWHQQGLIRVRSIIWWRRRWSPTAGWGPYTPSPHQDHVHIRLWADSPLISVTAGGGAMVVPPTDPGSDHPFPRLDDDEVLGPKTIDAIQWWVGVTRDSVMGDQTRRAMQRALGVKEDGVVGTKTIKALQLQVGADRDGIWGPKTTGALQRWLNSIAGY